jgi:hypothetical protein
METYKATALKDEGKIYGYSYRGVTVFRENGLFTFIFNRHDLTVIEKSFKSLAQAKAAIDELLDSKGRSTGGKPVVVTVRFGEIISALSHSDWHHPGARLVGA